MAVEYEDTITIPTPEGIELQYTLAGVGSRFTAQLVDVLLRLIALAALIGILSALGGGTGARIVFIVATFLAWFAYDVIFETWGGGRTPGKRWSRLRVVKVGGAPVGLAGSATRTLLRLIDEWATLGIAGMISISVSQRNQRLGDLAAATIVVRERTATALPESLPVVSGADELDVTAVSSTELSAIRDFVSRRDSLNAEARERVAAALAERMSAHVGGVPAGGLAPERLLEAVLAAKSTPR
jgi:uncharacterized RDD family membrane protein YckC